MNYPDCCTNQSLQLTAAAWCSHAGTLATVTLAFWWRRWLANAAWACGRETRAQRRGGIITLSMTTPYTLMK